MDAGEALTELTRLSPEIQQVAILDRDGAVVAATSGADSERLRRVAHDLLEVAAAVRSDTGVERVEVATTRGALYVVRSGGRVAVATARQPVVAALMVYDLRSCLARLEESAPVARKRRRKADVVDA